MIVNRRTMLRGALGSVAAAVALPTLEAMLDAHGEALANGEAIPCRYGVFFWGNGVRHDLWTPDQTGPGWQPKPLLQPFFDADTACADKITIVSGIDCPDASIAHHAGRGWALAGSFDQNDGTYGHASSPTSDQIVADQMQGPAPFRTLELGISERGFENSQFDRAVSWVDHHATLPAEHSPHALFERLFSAGVHEGGDTRLLDARMSVLDVVAEDANALRKRLGASDKARIDAHLDGIRDVETQLANTPTGCTLPTDPGDFPTQNGEEQLQETSRAMAYLLAHALACDLTRVFTFKFTGMQTDTFFWQTGAAEGLHTMTHDGSMQGMVGDAIGFMMKELAFLFRTLADVPEGTGSVLDNCGIYCTSELAEGYDHATRDMPIIIGGRAGGNLVSGIHHRGSGEVISRVPLTIMRACGADVASFGEGAGYADTTLSALET